MLVKRATRGLHLSAAAPRAGQLAILAGRGALAKMLTYLRVGKVLIAGGTGELEFSDSNQERWHHWRRHHLATFRIEASIRGDLRESLDAGAAEGRFTRGACFGLENHFLTNANEGGVNLGRGARAGLDHDI